MKCLFSIIVMCIYTACYSQKLEPELYKSCHRNKSNIEIYYNPLLDNYDLKFVKLDLEVSDLSTFIKGNATLGATAALNLDTLIFDFSDEMIIDSMFVNDVKVNFLHINNIIQYIFPFTINAGDEFVAQIYYHGIPDVAGRGVTNAFSTQWNKSVTWSLSESFHAYEWWPCKQVLSDKIDSTFIFLTCDNNCKAGSNGLLTNEVDLPNNKKRFEWKTFYPINYYLISFAVSEYQDYSFFAYPNGSDPIPVQNYIYNSANCLDYYKPEIDKTASLIELFSEKFGLYPFYNEKYGHCLTTLSGGMEHQTMTTLGSFSFNLVAHELGHMWFGDYVTCASWQDIWINEGFASYTEYVALENLYSKEDAADWMHSAHTTALTQANGSIYVPFEDAADENRIFSSSLSYKKGAAIIHTLRNEINNDELFFASIRSYLNQYSDSVATGEDFKNVIETETDLNLDSFFNQWYYGKGYPQFNVEYSQFNDSLTLNIFETTSSSETPLFQVHVDYKINYQGGDTTIRFFQSENEKILKIPFKYYITSIEVDPNNWILNNEGYVRNTDNTLYKINFCKIYPTIAADYLWVEFNTKLYNNIKTIKIYNLNGSLLKTFKTNNTKYALDLNFLSTGLYLLKSESGSLHETYRFIKQ